MKKGLKFLACLSILVMTFSFIRSSHSDFREQLGLVALWTFDKGTIQNNEVSDIFAKNSGTITGKPKEIQGNEGIALKFDGVVDCVKIINDIFFESISMEAVIRPVLGARAPIYDKYNHGIQLQDDGQVGIWIRAEQADTTKQWVSAYTAYPKDGLWHHVVGVAEDKKNIRIYLDGILKSTAPAPDPISLAYGASAKPSIAYTQHLNGIWYKGDIDEVAVYNAALGDIDVKKLYTTALAIESKARLTTMWGEIKQ